MRRSQAGCCPASWAQTVQAKAPGQSTATATLICSGKGEHTHLAEVPTCPVAPLPSMLLALWMASRVLAFSAAMRARSRRRVPSCGLRTAVRSAPHGCLSQGGGASSARLQACAQPEKIGGRNARLHACSTAKTYMKGWIWDGLSTCWPAMLSSLAARSQSLCRIARCLSVAPCKAFQEMLSKCFT